MPGVMDEKKFERGIVVKVRFEVLVSSARMDDFCHGPTNACISTIACDVPSTFGMALLQTTKWLANRRPHSQAN
jgi:hypothetical protein